MTGKIHFEVFSTIESGDSRLLKAAGAME